MPNSPETLKVFATETVRAKALGIGGGQPPAPPTNLPFFVTAAETVKTVEKSPGTPAMTKEQEEEKLPPEEIEKRQKVILEYTRLSGRYCPPHNTKSRWVKQSDLPRVVADGKDMVAMCHLPRGEYSGIAALAHSQIEEKDPLRFFVLPNGMVVVNAIITEHTKVPIFKEEGCLSFVDRETKKMIPRYNKITVTYQTLARKDENSDPVLSKPATEELSGGPSHTFQHEISHLNGVSIYDEGYTAESCEGLGDGLPVDPNWTRGMWKSGEGEELKTNKK